MNWTDRVVVPDVSAVMDAADEVCGSDELNLRPESTQAFPDYLTLGLLGTSARDEVEVTVYAEIERASGDGFHEEHHPQRVTIVRVEADGEIVPPVLWRGMERQLKANALESCKETA